jgi:signal transduction histidine kinase
MALFLASIFFAHATMGLPGLARATASGISPASPEPSIDQRNAALFQRRTYLSPDGEPIMAPSMNPLLDGARRATDGVSSAYLASVPYQDRAPMAGDAAPPSLPDNDHRSMRPIRLQPASIDEHAVVSPLPSSLALQASPAFAQTAWFKSFLVGFALIGAWGLYAMRVSFIDRRYRLLLHERSAERERIARDLHDTLLQGMQGILLQVETWAHGATLTDAQRAAALKIENGMRSVLIEGRDAISTLRQSPDQPTDFVASLLSAGNEAAAQSETRFSFRLLSEPRALRPDVCEEVLAIAREALLNAFRHADAESVGVTVDYGQQHLFVSVSDDGIGISERRLAERQKEGHWGLAGMRERTARLKGQLTVTTASEKGTLVELRVPQRRAYPTHSRLKITRRLHQRMPAIWRPQ